MGGLPVMGTLVWAQSPNGIGGQWMWKEIGSFPPGLQHGSVTGIAPAAWRDIIRNEGNQIRMKDSQLKEIRKSIRHEWDPKFGGFIGTFTWDLEPAVNDNNLMSNRNTSILTRPKLTYRTPTEGIPKPVYDNLYELPHRRGVVTSGEYGGYGYQYAEYDAEYHMRQYNQLNMYFPYSGYQTNSVWPSIG
jgi:hypothetical protein